MNLFRFVPALFLTALTLLPGCQTATTRPQFSLTVPDAASPSFPEELSALPPLNYAELAMEIVPAQSFQGVLPAHLRPFLPQIQKSPWKHSVAACFIVPPFGNRRYLPSTLPVDGDLSGTLNLAGADGMTEFASLVILPFQDLQQPRLTCSELVSDSGNTLSGKLFHAFPVAVWYRSGTLWNARGEPVLVPELLTDAVTVSPDTGDNFLRLKDGSSIWLNYPSEADPGPNFSTRCRPDHVAVSATPGAKFPVLEAKQLLLQLVIPVRTAPGIYRGKLTLSAEFGKPAARRSVLTLHVNLRVLAIDKKQYMPGPLRMESGTPPGPAVSSPSGNDPALKNYLSGGSRYEYRLAAYQLMETPAYLRRQLGLIPYLDFADVVCVTETGNSWNELLNPLQEEGHPRNFHFEYIVLGQDGAHIPTLQEAVRIQAIQDTWYASVLVRMARAAQKSDNPRIADAGRSTMRFLFSVDPHSTDPDLFRAWILRAIMNLQKLQED